MFQSPLNFGCPQYKAHMQLAFLGYELLLLTFGYLLGTRQY